MMKDDLSSQALYEDSLRRAASLPDQPERKEMTTKTVPVDPTPLDLMECLDDRPVTAGKAIPEKSVKLGPTLDREVLTDDRIEEVLDTIDVGLPGGAINFARAIEREANREVSAQVEPVAWKDGDDEPSIMGAGCYAPIPCAKCEEKEKEIQNLCSVEAELDTACKANAALEATIAQQDEEIATHKFNYEFMAKCAAENNAQLTAANALIERLQKIANDVLAARYMTVEPLKMYSSEKLYLAMRDEARRVAKLFLAAIEHHQGEK